MSQGQAHGVSAEHRGAGAPWEQASTGTCTFERERLLAHVRAFVIPGLEELVDLGAAPADLIALADRQSRRLRAELEPAQNGDDLFFGIEGVDDPACAKAREWVRGHLHDTALQNLELIAGDGFGTGLTAANIANLAGRVASDLRDWVDRPSAAELVPQLELITEQARTMQLPVELVVGATGEPPTDEQVEALIGAVREAVTNVRKHANASHVVVRIERDEDGHTVVTVTDDGIGFDLEQAENGTGLGVKRSIVGRMEGVGGHASLQGTPGGGTLVTLVTSRQGA
ncbi:MAG: sensor histidine kinase [Solirubrobacteraceae bacterium]